MNQDITTIYIYIIFSVLVFINIFVFTKGYFKHKERRKEELINKIIYGKKKNGTEGKYLYNCYVGSVQNKKEKV
jgi:hypothetical protein